MKRKVDVIIAGAGLSGLVTLLQLSRQHPEWTFALLEREPWIGGRMRASLKAEGSRSCGLHLMGSEFFDAIFTQLNTSEVPDYRSYVRSGESAGVLTGQKIGSLRFDQLTTADLAKAIGGGAAAKDWSLVEELLLAPAESLAESDATFGHAWKGDKKSGALIVLEHLAHLWGLPELGPSSLKTIAARARQFRTGLWTGRWDVFFEAMLADLRGADRLILETRAQIMAAQYQDKEWQIASTKGTFQADRLLVAQSPWEAILWLPKDLWPARLLNIASKTKPVSLVILSDVLNEACAELPDFLLIPSEEVQVISDRQQICYQATLSYELTVQAPAVVKAVKRLKRAKKKLQAALPHLKAEGDHIALLPTGWAHASTPQDQRWFDKLEMSQLQKKHLGFCGESYGSEGDTERNLLSSVKELVEAWS